MKAVTIILLALLTLATAACGKDGGITAQLHDVVYATPPKIEAKAVDALKGLDMKAASNAESDLLRETLIGVNMAFTSGTKADTTHLSVILSDTQTATSNQCFARSFSGDFANSTIGDWVKIDKLGHMMCLDNNCAYVLLIIERNHDSASMGAAVPVVLEDRSKDNNFSTGHYLPTYTQDKSFLRLNRDMNTLCNSKDGAESYTVPILPDNYEGSPADQYYDIDDYNTWF